MFSVALLLVSREHRKQTKNQIKPLKNHHHNIIQQQKKYTVHEEGEQKDKQRD